MANNGTPHKSLDPHYVAQILAAIRGNRAQLAKCVADLEKLRQRTVWTERDWQQCYAIHRQADRLRDLISEGREILIEAGIDITR